MAEYNGVHIEKYQVRGVQYVRLWWYTGRGSQRKTKSIGRAKGQTKATLNRARLKQEQALTTQPGMVSAGKAPTLGAWVSRWKAGRPELSEGTLRLVDDTKAKLLEYGLSEDTRIDRITRAEAAAWRAWLVEQELSEATVCKYVRCASSMFGERHGAAGLDLIPFNPFARLKKTAKTAVKGYPELTPQQEAALLDACHGPAWRAMVALCLYAGVRRGEALALRWSDVQWGKGRIRVPNLKTSGGTTSRDCRMEPALEKILLECFEVSEDERIAPIENNWNRDMAATIKRAGLDVWPDVFHALRRRRASLWKLVYPAYVVNAWLGHSEAVSNAHYLTVPEECYSALDSAQHRRNTEAQARTD